MRQVLYSIFTGLVGCFVTCKSLATSISHIIFSCFVILSINKGCNTFAGVKPVRGKAGHQGTGIFSHFAYGLLSAIDFLLTVLKAAAPDFGISVRPGYPPGGSAQKCCA